MTFLKVSFNLSIFEFEKKELYLRFSFYAYPEIGQTYRNLKVTIGDSTQTYDTSLGTGTINMTFTN